MVSGPPSHATPGQDQTLFSIRPLSSIDDFRRAEILQRDIWGITDDIEIVPKDVMLIVQKNGGLALGAFNHTNEMIGVLFGFLGRTVDGQWKHCSHMLGVLPSYRKSGAGEALKVFQREYVRKQGLDLITWTVNPLEGINASLNFGKLGVVCRQYFPNFYGEMDDGLNRGLPSDRFEVEWWINSPRVEKRLGQKEARQGLPAVLRSGAQSANRTVLKDGFRMPLDLNLDLNSPGLLFEVPADYQAIKSHSMNNALLWIAHSRMVFETCFKNGYVVTEFFSETDPLERRNYFVLKRDLAKILG
ncbi:MAG TPA: hypothetical protein VGK00_13270 [Anaerolineales bacterium]|jgi:predicted GNAT superfamily acetyltransferase